jgi:hypothetical protein
LYWPFYGKTKMSKNQQKNTFNDSSGLLNSQEGNTSSALTGTNTALGAASGAYGTAGNAYAGLNTAGINSILSPATSAASAVNATGGYAQPQLNTLESQESQNLGGLDPGALASLSGQYQNLISSGGISDATAAAMQRQAVSGVGSLYGTLNNQQQRTQAATGGQGGGGQTAEMARQLGQSEASAITGVNADVGQLRQQGTEAGLSGASNLAASQAAAQNAAANTFSGTQSGVAGGIQSGANLLSGLGSTALSGNLASAGGLTNVAGGLTNIAGEQAGLYGTELGAQGTDLSAMSGIANAQQGVGGNILQGVGALGGLASGAGNLITGLSKLNPPCWIAEAVYGELHPSTIIARSFIIGFSKSLIGFIILMLYMKFGQYIAKKVRKYGILKLVFKQLFDIIPGVKYANN